VPEGESPKAMIQFLANSIEVLDADTVRDGLP
jgi:hypothetical protein